MKLNFWPFNRKKSAPKPITPALQIIYMYPGDQVIRTFTYSSAPGEPIWHFRTTRRFLKWYFGRLQSPTIFIIGGDGRKEWRREHILSLELFKDERDVDRKKR